MHLQVLTLKDKIKNLRILVHLNFLNMRSNTMISYDIYI